MEHMAKSNRPERLPKGHHLSIHYKIEGLIRLAEGRMFYLASNDRPENPHIYCWSCGCEKNPAGSDHCSECGEPLHPRKFLISTRWHKHGFDGTEAFFRKDISHPFLHPTLDCFFENNCLWSVVEWTNQDFMLNQCAPLQADTVLKILQRTLGLLGYFHENGIALEEIHPRNFLYNPELDDFIFFEPDVRICSDTPIPENERGYEVPSLAQTLLYLTSVSDHELRTLLRSAVEGCFTNSYNFGRAIEKFMGRGIPPTKQIDNISAISDVGLIRNLNEDNWNWTNINEHSDLFVVADGMGGHDCGEIASQMAVEVICEEAIKRYQESNPYSNSDISIDTLEMILENSFQEANNSIKRYSEKVGSDMGTTMVCSLLLSRNGQKFALVANVGDSRGYLFRGGTLHQITKDHSLVAKMVEQNQITKEEARVHPHSNILLRTVGTERDISIDVFRVGLQKDDVLLLCSDGLWGEVEDEKLEETMRSDNNLSQVCRSLLRASHLGGGRDNCTIMVVRV
jgi:protein phosphatase